MNFFFEITDQITILQKEKAVARYRRAAGVVRVAREGRTSASTISIPQSQQTRRDTMLRKQSAFVFAIGVAALAPLFCGSTAQAQATRTWVSGVGDDANPCSRTAPCKTFAGAISKTAVNGIINCLDPGGFGAVTITKSITLDCTATLGSVLAAGTNGININAAGVVVTLRGLDIEGVGTGLQGIAVFLAGVVHVEQCRIVGFQSGSAIGINYASAGTLIVTNTHLHTNGTGIVLNAASGVNNMTLRDVISNQNSSNGVLITSAVNHSGATIDRTTLAFNGGSGLALNGAGTVAIIGNSTVVGNATGVSNSGGTLQSFKNNQIGGNGVDGTPITAFPGPGTPLQ